MGEPDRQESRAMNYARYLPQIVTAMVIVHILFGGTAAYAVTEGKRHAGWYLSVGAGASGAATVEQAGRNRDTTCYPNDDCRHLPGGTPAGYRWYYDLHPDTGPTFELAVGRALHDFRLELAASGQVFNMEQAFTGSSYLDGSTRRLIPEADRAYASTNTATVDDLTIHSLTLNAYYDIALARSRITPYLGVGLGVAFAELSGLHYRGEYVCTDDTRCERPERFNSRQDADVSDTVAAGHFHAGADYRLSDRLLVGLKMSYSLVDDIGSRGTYAYHAVPGLTNFNHFSGIRYWSFLLNFKYLLRPGDRAR